MRTLARVELGSGVSERLVLLRAGCVQEMCSSVDSRQLSAGGKCRGGIPASPSVCSLVLDGVGVLRRGARGQGV